MIHIYFSFLWGYYKEHKSRIFFSLLGISLGIALFFTVQVNSWRAEASIIDAQLGYQKEDYIGQFQYNIDGKYGPDSILRELYFILPDQFILEPSLTIDAFVSENNATIEHIPIIGKDIVTFFLEEKFQNPTEDNSVGITPRFLMSDGLYQNFFQNEKTRKIHFCQKDFAINKDQVLSISKDGNFIVTDIEYLQSICGLNGFIKQIFVRLKIAPEEKADSHNHFKEALRITNDNNWVWESKEMIQERSGKALGSLKINLTIVSLISVLISLFMVANSFSGIYLARRKEFGILLSIGNSRIQNLFLFLSQSVVLGFLGGALGILLGWQALRLDLLMNVSTITDTNQISSYFRIPIWIYTVSMLIGVIGAIGSSLFSSLRSFFIRPIELIREKESTSNPSSFNNDLLRLAYLGIGMVLFGAVIGFLPTPKSLLPGLAGVGFVIFGFVSALPYLSTQIIRIVNELIQRFITLPIFKIAWEEIRLEPLQNTLTTATILLSSSLVITLTSLTDSYEKTLVKWVDEDNLFDYSIVNPSKISAGLPGVPKEIVLQLAKYKEIESIEPFIIQPKFSIGNNYYTLHVYPFESKLDEVIVSSNFCYLEKKCTGDALEIQTEKSGNLPFKIIAEKEHFFSERGTIMMSLATFESHFSYNLLNSVRVKFNDKITSETKLKILKKELSFHSNDLQILDKEGLKSIYLEGMKSVFSILESLKVTALLISFLALLTSLIYNIREKSKLIATLRAIGLSSPQLFKYLLFQSLFFITVGIVMGILNSLIISPIVIYGVNRNAFGWLLDLHFPLGMLLYLSIIIPITSLTVSLYPFLEARKKPLRESLNYE